MALNELLGAFPSAQSWVPLTRHPGSLLRGIPFKTIICQQSSSPCFCVCISKVIICHTVCFSLPLSHELLSPLVLLPPPYIRITCYSGILLSIQIGSSGPPWGADPESDMFKRDQNDRMWQREESRRKCSKRYTYSMYLQLSDGERWI